MSSTVQMGGFQISSNSESAEEMVAALKPPEDKGKEPKVLVDRGRKVEPKAEDDQKASEAARELGKRGGEAAARAREEKAKEAEAQPEAKEAAPPVEAKAEEKPEAKETPPEPKKGEGDPRHDPEARVKRATQEAAELRRLLEDERRGRQEDREVFLGRLERVERAVKPPEEKPEAPSGKPRLKDILAKHEAYEDGVEEYIEARLAEREREEQERSFEAAQEERIEKHVTGFQERMRKATEADPDLMQRIDPRLLNLSTSFQAAAKGQPIGPAEMLADLYTSSEWAPEVLIYLSANKDAVIRLLKCDSPTALTREFGRLEAKVAREEKAPAPAPRRTVSNAPPPLQPVSTSATENEPDLYGEISYDEFRRRAASRRR